jgi:WD40 repeat protein
MEKNRPFFQVGGNLDEDAPSYIERPADAEMLTALERGELCLVLAPRQTGKSSLMVHTRARLRDKGVRVGVVDLQPLGSQPDPARWFNDVVFQIEDSLQLATDTLAWWEQNQRLGPMQRFLKFLEDVVLGEIQGNMALFFDEIDSVLNLPFADDFFTTLRSFYNFRSTKPELKRLSFALLGVAMASELIKDRTRTPFNIGTSIQITDFTPENIHGFQKVLGENSQPLIDRIFYWTDGQPFLVQTLAAAISAVPAAERTPEQIDREIETKFFKGKVEQDTHLGFMQNYLLGDRAILRKTLQTYKQVLQGKPVARDKQSPAQNRLRLAGVVRVADERLQPRNRIYSRIFDPQWIKAHTPSDALWLAAYGAAITLLVALAWVFLIQPLLFPRFPQIKQIIRYSPDPSVNIRIPLNRTNVPQITLKRSDTWKTEQVFDRKQTLLVKFKLTERSFDALKLEKSIPGDILLKLKPLENQEFTDEGNFLNALNEHIGKEQTIKYKTLILKHAPALFPLEIRYTVSGLEKGEYQHTLELSGGWPRQTRTIPVKIVYYPNWEVKQIPDKRLADLNPIVEVYDDRIIFKNAMNARGLGRLAGFSPPITAYKLSADRDQLLFGTADGQIQLLDVTFTDAVDRGLIDESLFNDRKQRSLQTFTGHQQAVLCLAFAADGRTVISGSRDQSVKLWDIQSGKELHTFAGHRGAVTALAVAPDGDSVFSGSDDHTIKQWDLLTGRELYTFDVQNAAVTALAVAPDGKMLVSGGADGSLRCYALQTKALLHNVKVHKGVVVVAFSQNGKWLVSGDANGAVKMWDTATWNERDVGEAFGNSIRVIDFAAQDQLVFAQTATHGLKTYETSNGNEIQVYSGHQGYIAMGLSFSRSGNLIVSGSLDKSMKLWNVKNAQLLRVFQHSGEVLGTRFLSDDTQLISAEWAGDNALRLWEIETGKELCVFRGHESGIAGLDISPNGKLAASASQDKTVKIWDIERCQELKELQGHEDVVNCVAFSPDGKFITSGSSDNTIKLWDVDTGQELQTFKGHDSDVYGIAFSPDGKILISGSGDNTLKLWDVSTGKELRTLTGHTETVQSVAFSPNGKNIVSASADNTVKLWDVATGQILRDFAGYKGRVFGVAFSPDGKWVASGGADGVIKIWWAAVEPPD